MLNLKLFISLLYDTSDQCKEFVVFCAIPKKYLKIIAQQSTLNLKSFHYQTSPLSPYLASVSSANRVLFILSLVQTSIILFQYSHIEYKFPFMVR